MAKKTATKQAITDVAAGATALLEDGAEFQEYQPDSPVDFSTLLSTGVGILNLCCSGRYDGALPQGHLIRYFGDSGTGKTFMNLTLLAEAANDPRYKKWALVYDDIEHGALIDLAKFGTKLKQRIDWRHSNTLEEAYYAIHAQLEKGPCIWIMDSMDALTTRYEEGKTKERRAAHGTAKKIAGDMTDGKAKLNSQYLRQIKDKLKETGSILIIVSQVRDSIGSMFPADTTAGGRALKFYASMEVHSQAAGKIKKKVTGIDRPVGIKIKLTTKKNRLVGGEWSCVVPLYFDTGLDDIGAAITFLVSEKHWDGGKSDDDGSGDGPVSTGTDFGGFSGSRLKLTQMIAEMPDGRDVLGAICTRVMAEVKHKLSSGRPSRYA